MPGHTPAPTPIRAVYGFAMYLSFNMFFILYLIWAFVPHSWFEHFGVTYLPQRYWAIAVPIYVITAVLIFGFVIYPSINLCITPDIDDLRTIADKSTSERSNKEVPVNGDISCNKCVCVDQGNCGLQIYLQDAINFDEKFVPQIEDLNITDVSRLLYLKTKLE